MWNNLDGEMRRIADILEVPIDEECWPTWVDWVRLSAMKERAHMTAPEDTPGALEVDQSVLLPRVVNAIGINCSLLKT